MKIIYGFWYFIHFSWGNIINTIIDISKTTTSSVYALNQSLSKDLIKIVVGEISFVTMTFFILSFFLFLSMYLEIRKNSLSKDTSPFFTSYLDKIRSFITPSRLMLFLAFSIFLALAFHFYFSAIIFSLLLLNIKLKNRYLSLLILFTIFGRLLWFFMPLSEIVSMTFPYRSFTCVFSLVGYVFFLRYHKYLILWIGIFLRLLLGVGIEDGLVLSMIPGATGVSNIGNQAMHVSTTLHGYGISDNSPFWDRMKVVNSEFKKYENQKNILNCFSKYHVSNEMYFNLHNKQNGSKLGVYNAVCFTNPKFRIGLLHDSNGAIFLSNNFYDTKFASYDLPVDPKRYSSAFEALQKRPETKYLTEANQRALARSSADVLKFTENLNQHALFAHNPQFENILKQIEQKNGKIKTIVHLNRDETNNYAGIGDRQIMVTFENTNQLCYIIIDHYQPTKNAFKTAGGKETKLKEFLFKETEKGTPHLFVPIICIDPTNCAPLNIDNKLKQIGSNEGEIKICLNLFEYKMKAIRDSSLSLDEQESFALTGQIKATVMSKQTNVDDYTKLTVENMSTDVFQALINKHKIN